MTLSILTEKDFIGFLFVFFRTAAMISFLPIFGDRAVPAPLKGILALLLSFLIYPFLKGVLVPVEAPGFFPLFLGLIGEVLIGFVMGLMVRFFFTGIQFAGEMIGFQMGFAIVNVIDPVFSIQVSLIAQLEYYMAMLLFLAIDGHHGLFLAMTESFQVVPPLAFCLTGSLMEFIIQTSKELFVIAVKLSAPVIAVLVFTHVALGLVARTVPQINVFIVGFPLQIAIGFLFLGLSAQFVLGSLESCFMRFPGLLRAAFQWMAP